MFSTIGSIGYPRDESYLVELIGRAYDRDHDSAAYLRQVAAVLTQPNRTRALRSANLPTVVMHGLADPLVAASGGRAIARAIPEARFVGFPGMGHDLPRDLWRRFADEIAMTAEEGEKLRAARLNGQGKVGEAS
jgi:pimeloyl-ACP methyl ester carboxylesterase